MTIGTPWTEGIDDMEDPRDTPPQVTPQDGPYGIDKRTQPYWLIEKGSPAQWWKEGWGSYGDYVEKWTASAHLALWFPTRESAQMELDRIVSFGVKGIIHVTDHLDMDRPPDEVATPPAGLSVKQIQAIMDRVDTTSVVYQVCESHRLLQQICEELKNEVYRISTKHDEVFSEWSAIWNHIRNEVNDPDPLPCGPSSHPTLLGLVMGLKRERDQLRDAFERSQDDVKFLREKVAALEATVVLTRPKADCYDRICQSLGIEHDILGYINKLTQQLAAANMEIERLKECAL